MPDADDDLRQDLAGVVLAELRAGRTRLSPPAVAALRILGGDPRRSPELRRSPKPRPAHRGRLTLAAGAAAAVIAGGAVLAGTAGDQQSAPAGTGPAATAAAPSGTTEPAAAAPTGT